MEELDETDNQAGLGWLLAIIVRSRFPIGEQMQAYAAVCRSGGNARGTRRD